MAEKELLIYVMPCLSFQTNDQLTISKKLDTGQKHAYMDGKDCSIQSICISTIHGGHSKGREHMYRMYGIRAMHGAIAEDAEALPDDEVSSQF